MTLYDQGQIVTADKVKIKPFFVKRYQSILGDRYDEFIKYSFTYIRKCLRVNTIKISVEKLKKRLEDQGWVLKPIPWCKEGFFVQGHKTLDRYDIGNLTEHALGYFYIQESASMIPPVVLFSDLKNAKDDQLDDLKVLDLCAAPGSKTSQLAQYMKNKGILIANDVEGSRLKPLNMNLQRMGISNTLITLNAFQEHKKSPRPRNPFKKDYPQGFFDRILVDAPCSGTGTIRRSFKVLTMYSKGLVQRMSSVQKSLIKQAFEMLKPGGIMVYSTCSQEPQENEEVVSHLLDIYQNAELLDINLDIKRSKAITEFEDKKYNKQIKKVLRIYPQDNDSEGFFVSRIRKKV